MKNDDDFYSTLNKKRMKTDIVSVICKRRDGKEYILETKAPQKTGSIIHSNHYWPIDKMIYTCCGYIYKGDMVSGNGLAKHYCPNCGAMIKKEEYENDVKIVK